MTNFIVEIFKISVFWSFLALGIFYFFGGMVIVPYLAFHIHVWLGIIATLFSIWFMYYMFWDEWKNFDRIMGQLINWAEN